MIYDIQLRMQHKRVQHIHFFSLVRVVAENLRQAFDVAEARVFNEYPQYSPDNYKVSGAEQA